ncbi:spermidine/putrescine transport system permease protein PotB [Desulfosporosinus acididurans]|uniref:Spermidine/putrescine transport system permease protein PotB n=1 Tax=Desulfosporosinus acididurans TaxID=476652 RepID=A0A0J1FRM3_9FIRM|nr:ABC transporter permease [Desulfosporosinus acididurans]KLU65952.1 spermidine/putrescine transport system permease protein PotB [Desulfosporosinus acididurans]
MNTVAPKKRRAFSRSIPLFLMVGPVILWLLIFVAAPLVYILVISFMKKGTYGGVVASFNFENYLRIYDPLYLKIFFVSIVIALATTVLCLVIGYPFAYIIARASDRNKSILLSLIMLPFWTNSLIRTYGWIILLRTNGTFNTLLLSTHLISQPLQMLYTNGAVMVGMVYTLFPFMVLPLYSSIEKLDRSLLEAANDLGAKPRRAFWRVTLPLTVPGVFAGCIQVFIPTLGYFFISDLLGGGNSVLVGNLIRNQFLAARDWPFGAALSILLIVFTIVLMRVYKHFGGSLENIT